MRRLLTLMVLSFSFCGSLMCDGAVAFDDPSPQQLSKWLKRFPAADTDKDGTLTVKEAAAFRKKLTSVGQSRRKGATKTFQANPGWDLDRFPDHAVSYKTPAEIKDIYARQVKGNKQAVMSYDKPTDGALRIVATGHSFMAPGFQTLPLITRAAGLKAPPLNTHTGGGMTGSARYKWEQENGIYQFDKKPVPKLLASISNAKWDAMMWGPYYNDRPKYYSCWIDFCLKYNPDMKFYLADAWPQLEQFDPEPTSESALTYAAIAKLGAEKNKTTAGSINTLNKQYPGRLFVMPTSNAMVLAVREYHAGNLPGVDGIHKSLGRKERSLWRDHLGHLGPGLEDLEGYVFYATMYGKSPELIEGDIRRRKPNSYPTAEMDKVFRRIAWEAVVNHPLSGVVDKDGDGLND